MAFPFVACFDHRRAEFGSLHSFESVALRNDAILSATCDRPYDAVSTFHDDDFCKARLPMLCSGCLELTADNCR